MSLREQVMYSLGMEPRKKLSFYQSPLRLLIVIVFSIFVIEAAVMYLLSFFPELSAMNFVFIDAFLLCIILLPVVYFFMFRPLTRHISEQKYRRLIESAKDAILLADIDSGIIVEANLEAEKLIGLPREKIIGMNQTELHPKEERGRYKEIFKKSVANESDISEDLVVINSKGQRIDVNISSSVIDIGGRKVIQGFFRDITEHKKTERAIRLNEEKYSNLFHRSNDGIFIHDLDGNIKDLNHKALDMFGYTKSEILSQKIPELHPASDLDKSKSAFEEISKKGAVNFEIGFRKKDGTVFPAEVSSSLFEIGGKKVIQGIIRDISERKQAEMALQETEERFRQLFEQSDDGIVLLDIDTSKLVDANQAAMAIFGYSKNELFEQSQSLFGWIYERQEDIQLNNVHDELPIVRRDFTGKDGTTKTLACRCQIISIRRHDVLYCSFRDMTEKMRMEKEAKMAESKLLHANKMTALGTLVSEIAHEINNPNNFIMFNTPLLLDAWQDAMPVLEEYYNEHGDFSIGGLAFSEMRVAIPRLLSGISDGSSRIKHIIDNLRDFARHDSVRIEGDVEINNCIKSGIMILENQIKKSTHNFNLDMQEKIPAVKGNAKRLEQVIINLIMNALQALPDKHHGIWVFSSFETDSGHVVIKVRDEGVGMHREVLERIKEPFYSTKHGDGMGLGLSISYSIIEKHHGSLEFESTPGRGTTAIIRLPVI